MAMFLVNWDIGIEADTAWEAAEKARGYQVKDGTSALVFDVTEKVSGATVCVDLYEQTITKAEPKVEDADAVDVVAAFIDMAEQKYDSTVPLSFEWLRAKLAAASCTVTVEQEAAFVYAPVPAFTVTDRNDPRQIIAALMEPHGRVDIHDTGECQWCGREYGDEVPEGRICPADDCPANIARAFIKSAPSGWADPRDLTPEA